jgi:hypothetical protein
MDLFSCKEKSKNYEMKTRKDNSLYTIKYIIFDSILPKLCHVTYVHKFFFATEFNLNRNERLFRFSVTIWMT